MHQTSLVPGLDRCGAINRCAGGRANQAPGRGCRAELDGSWKPHQSDREGRCAGWEESVSVQTRHSQDRTAKQMHRKQVGRGTWPRPGAVTTCSVSWSTNSHTNRHTADSYQCQPTHTLTVIRTQTHPPLSLHALTRPAQAVRQTVRITAPLPALRATQADPASASGRGKERERCCQGSTGGYSKCSLIAPCGDTTSLSLQPYKVMGKLRKWMEVACGAFRGMLHRG